MGGMNGLILFVVNENSGNGRGKRTWAKVEDRLLRLGVKYERISALSPKEAVALVRDKMASGRIEAVVAIGGDGTLHNLLPVVAASGVPYGLIPSGSGNDTSRALGIPKDPLKALELILAGHIRRVDILETTTSDGVRRLALASVAIGIDAAVAADVNQSAYKRWCNRLGIGSLAYIIGLLRALARFRPGPVTVTIDGTAHRYERGWLAAVTSVSTYGGGLKICPSALPDDGHLHVCVVHSCSALRLLSIFPTVLLGRHVHWKRYVALFSGREADVRSEVPFLAYGDGEPSGETPVKVAIRAGQLDFLISASG